MLFWLDHVFVIKLQGANIDHMSSVPAGGPDDDRSLSGW
jgi:hypothetical protein